MECGGGLIVLQALENRAIYDHFMVLQLPSDDPECIVLLVVINLHLAQPR